MPSRHPYSSYRQTDLPWLGQIPTHWEVQRAKFIFKKMNRPVRKEDDVVTAFRDGTVTLRTKRRTEGFTFSIKEIGYQGIRKGDLVIHQMDGFAGAIGVSDSNGKSSPIYSVCVPIIPASTYYYAYLLRHMARSDFILSLAKGIRERSSDFRFDVFKELTLPIPPLEEQQIIAAYLDQQIAKIDALVAKKQRLLDLLAEQRTTIINQAVTRGNAKNSVQKDKSPAPWLFTLPSGWKRQQLKHISFTKGRIGYENLRAEEYTEEGPYLVSSAHFKDGKIEWERCNHVARERFEMAPDIILQKHDVLFMKDGALMGKLAYVDDLPGEACLNSHILLIRPLKGSYIPKFLFYVLMTDVFKAYMEQERKGTTFFGFSEHSMGNFPISFPSIAEQKEICDYIDRKTKRLDDLAAKAEAVIERLGEYRAALISSAVTGKVDVSQEF